MRFDKTEGGRIIQREQYNVKPCVVILQLYIGVTHPSTQCTEEATWEGPDCNSQR